MSLTALPLAKVAAALSSAAEAGMLTMRDLGLALLAAPLGSGHWYEGGMDAMESDLAATCVTRAAAP